MRYTAQPIGRARTYTRDEYAAILSAIGRSVDDDEPREEIARRINWAISPESPRYLANLRAFRKACGFAEATKATPRGLIIDRFGNFAG